MGIHAETMDLKSCICWEEARSNKNGDLSSSSTMTDNPEDVGQAGALYISVFQL